MKYSLTLSLFLGLISKETAALRLQHHHHHHHKNMVQYDGDKQDWVQDCAPGRNPFIPGTGNAGTGGSYPGVGITCQGFAQKKSGDYTYPGDGQAWVDKCDPAQDTVAQKNPSGAGTSKDAVGAKEAKNGGSFPGVGVECQGLAQKNSTAKPNYTYPGDGQAWVDDCPPGRNPFIPGNGNAGTVTSYPNVGIECQGLAQKNSTAKPNYTYPGDGQAWVDDCAPGRNPFIPGNGNAGTVTSYPNVGIECQGLAQVKSNSTAKPNYTYPGDGQAWVDDCAPGRNPFIPGNGNAGTVTSYPNVGIECQGLAQKKSTYNGDTQDWVDKCDPTQDTVAQKNPSGAGTSRDAVGAKEAKNGGSFPGVGVECQGLAQKKSSYNGDTQDWVPKCDANQDTVAQKNPSGAGTHEDKFKGSFPGVGVECQGLA